MERLQSLHGSIFFTKKAMQDVKTSSRFFGLCVAWFLFNLADVQLKLDENVYQQKVFQTANAFGCQ